MHQNIPNHPIWITHPIWINQQNPGIPGVCTRGFLLYLRVFENPPNAKVTLKVTLVARGGSGAKAPPLAVRQV